MLPNVDSLLCLIPARGGSKQVRRKNLRTVGGRTLVQIAVEACRPHGRVVVSTDDEDIAAVARMCGAEVWDRPAELATDTASVDDLVEHTRLTYQGALLVFQPTVPQAACVLAAFIEDARFVDLGSTMGCEHRHLLWNDELFMAEEQSRSNRQGENRWYMQEVGVRFYPSGVSTIDHCWPSPLPLVDVDTPDDLAAVRAASSSKRVLFRVIANSRVGSGHVRRCVQIADELQHHTVAFEPASGSDMKLASSLCGGYPLVTDGWRRDLCVNDVLDSSEEQMFELRFASPVVALEDLGPGARHASLVVNELYGADGGNTLCGPAWAVLRPVFTAVPQHRFDHRGSPRLLVTFGGTDPADLTGLLRQVTSRQWEWDTVVVPPPGQERSPHDVASLLCWADLVVCSGGRTVWEAMRCGTPALVLCQNPRELSHTHLTPAFGVLNLGLGRLVEAGRLVDHLAVLLGDRQLLADMSERMEGVVDGKGVLRIAHRIEGLLGGL